MKQEPGRRQPGIPVLQGGEDVNSSHFVATAIFRRILSQSVGTPAGDQEKLLNSATEHPKIKKVFNPCPAHENRHKNH